MKSVFFLQIFNRVSGTFSVSRSAFTNKQAAVLHQADLLETYKDADVHVYGSFEPNNYVFNIIECELFDY